MEWTIRIDTVQHCCRVEISGSFEPEKLGRLFDDILGDPAWQRGWSLFWDYRNCLFPDMSIQQVMALADMRQQRDADIGDGKSAVLVDGALAAALVQAYRNLNNHKISGRIKLFTDLYEAEAWLAD